MKKLTNEEILNLPMQVNDAKAATIKDYLKKLLKTLWIEGEGFKGKRPFGNSGWEYDLYIPLIKAEVIQGEFDEDGFIDDCDTKAADQIILEVINSL